MKKNNKIIAVQGFGYVGAANAVNIATSKYFQNYKILCFEKENLKTVKFIDQAKKGIFPHKSNDKILINNFKKLTKNKILDFSFDKKKYKLADIILITINYDLKNINQSKKNFLKGFNEIISYAKNNCLIIVESTIPPGTCEFLLKPFVRSIQKKRNIKLFLSHAFERVTPGNNYLNSCRNTHRVYSGIDKKSKKLCGNFLKKITNIKKFSVTELQNTTASETCKIIENSYRAVNIAFIDEWMKFCKAFNLNLFDIINAIKKRTTHNNIMLPGLGVGGYCLTKDPIFGKLSSKFFLKNKKINFPFSELALRVNSRMINNSLDYIKDKYGKSLKNKKILIIGAAYKNDVGDVRDSPSIKLANKLKKFSSKLFFYDPLVVEKFKSIKKVDQISDFYDIILLCLKHKTFKNFSFLKFNKMKKTTFFDLNNVLGKKEFNKINKINKIYKLSYS
jgi:UDP-N-acetyl-D-glucosamine dehydrogenase